MTNVISAQHHWDKGDVFDHPEYVDSNGVWIAVYRDGPDPERASKPPIIFLHGFPELARSFRHQMAFFAESGHPVLAPDMRGYHRSEKPARIEDYRMEKLVGDVGAILDHFGIKQAIFVGHDLGAFVLWALPYYMPDRLLGCAGLSYPLLPHPPINPLWLMRLLFHRDMYMLQFQKLGLGEAILETDIDRTLRFFFRKVDPADIDRIDMSFRGKSLNILEQLTGPSEDWLGVPLLDEKEFQVYREIFSSSGFRAPIHWYRNLKRNWQDMKRFLVKGRLPKLDVPCLVITAEYDFATPPRLSDGMGKLCRSFTRVDLKGCSHWLHMEKPEEVNDALVRWLAQEILPR